jgi:RimJ/RimL family protein N-acetyltransferase
MRPPRVQAYPAAQPADLRSGVMVVQLNPGSIGPRVERNISDAAPARPRALAVIDGVLAGSVWADEPDEPSWTVVVEKADGTVYAGGAVTASVLDRIMPGVETAAGDLIFGFTGPDDPLRGIVPPDPYYRGEAIDFTKREPPEGEGAVLAAPPDVTVTRIGSDLLPQTEWYADTLVAYGSAERFATLAVGVGVLAEGRLVAECIAGPRVRGTLEMGVATRAAHRGRGYGTLVCRHVARACEAAGDTVWWNANANNEPSLAIARRLGFRVERPYELIAYRTGAWPTRRS